MREDRTTKKPDVSNLSEVKLAIMQDSENINYTEMGWVPIFQVFPEAEIVVIGPAPGRKTQNEKIVFKDKSGDKLREWMGVTDALFYESHKIAVLPLDFYFPGKGKSSDLPPRPGFAEKWHPKLLALMPKVKLIILIGVYAQKFYLKNSFKGTLTETVFAYQEYLPRYFPLVHPSPLNFRWVNKNPDFENKIVPKLKLKVKEILETK